MKTKVSVIMPVYNAKNYIGRCLESLLSQTLKEIEVICVLDCPTDGTDVIVENYAGRDPRIKVIKNDKNLHIGESRNKGIAAAQGEFIGFSDHDDYSEPSLYETLYNEAKKTGAHVAMCERGHVNKEGDKIEMIDKDHHYTTRKCLANVIRNKPNLNTVFIWNKIYERKFLIDNHILFTDNRILPAGEDIIFNFNVFRKLANYNSNEIVAYTPQVLYWHVFYENNTSNYNRTTENLCQYTNEIARQMEEDAFCQSDSIQKDAYIGFLSVLSSALYYACKENKLNVFRIVRGLKHYPYLLHTIKKNWVLYNRQMSINKNIIALFVKLIG